jgi:hypothetical protein
MIDYRGEKFSGYNKPKKTPGGYSTPSQSIFTRYPDAKLRPQGTKYLHVCFSGGRSLELMRQ